MNNLLESRDLGEMEKYIGYKMDHNKKDGYIKLTQPVLIKSIEDEFKLGEHGLTPSTPAET
eukprot:5517732-Ditylum_brightwellii.AAC.1